MDSNPSRTFGPTSVDAIFFGLGQGQASLTAGRLRLFGSYDLGGRKFILQGTQDTLVQSALINGDVSLWKFLSVGITGRGRDRRGAGRDYSDLVGEGVLRFVPDPSIDVTARVGAHRFLYWPQFGYSFSAPEFTLSARYNFNRRHSMFALGNLGLRTYNSNARNNPSLPAPAEVVRRKDNVFFISAGYSYRGPFQVNVGYSYYDQSSNSWAETIRRHRITASAGVKLPFDFFVMLSGALQFSLYPEGVFLSDEIVLLDDDENSSSVTLKVVRPLNKYLDLDVRYALYVNTFPQALSAELNWYLRHLVTVGVAVNF